VTRRDRVSQETLSKHGLDRRQALRLFAAIGAAGAAAPILSGCGIGEADPADQGPPIRSGPPLKIGMVVPQTGASKPFGDEMANGFKLYLDQNEGRLGGYRINLITADEGETAESGLAAADKLIKQDGVIALTGIASTPVMLAVKDLVETSQIPLIGSNASPSSLQGVRYTWRTSYVAKEPGQALGRWIAERARGTVAVVAGDNPDDREKVEGFLEVFTDARGRLDGAARYLPSNTRDFSSTLTAVRDSGAGTMFCSFGGATAVEFLKQFKTAGFPDTFTLYAPGPLTEGFALKQQGDTARGVFTAMNYSPDLDNPANRRFVANYQKVFNAIPSTYAMASFDAASVFDKALLEAGTDTDSVSLNAAIGRLGQIVSPRGGWQFSQNRTPLQKWYMRQVRNDGNVLSNVLTAELATMG
jgi:branched-chain amino acid transport system substrate-binding protein